MKILFSFLAIIVVLNIFTGCEPETNDNTQPVIPEEDSVAVLNDSFKGEPVVILNDSSVNVFISFSRRLEDGTILEFKKSHLASLIEFEDTEGNLWNYEGTAVSGTRKGTVLKPVRTVKGLWLGISSIYPKVSLFNKSAEERIDYENPTTDWLINPDQIQEIAAKDATPALSYPKFSEYGIKDLPGKFMLTNQDEVIIVEHNKVIKIYPIKIMNWHEVVNDTIGGLSITLSHSPLTASTTVFKYDGSSGKLLFGVSGKVHNNNLILYDKKTNSLWSQIKNYSINGPLIGEELVPIPFLETTFKYAGEAHQGKQNLYVMSFDTGFDRDYQIFPYGSYRTNSLINYPITYQDNRVPAKEVVLAIIIDNEAKVYRYSDFH